MVWRAMAQHDPQQPDTALEGLHVARRAGAADHGREPHQGCDAVRQRVGLLAARLYARHDL
eukprot:5653512-Heterocapsa_arctica.AAC.1